MKKIMLIMVVVTNTAIPTLNASHHTVASSHPARGLYYVLMGGTSLLSILSGIASYNPDNSNLCSHVHGCDTQGKKRNYYAKQCALFAALAAGLFCMNKYLEKK